MHGAIMAALISRGQTGKGVWIDCSLFEAQVRRPSNPSKSGMLTVPQIASLANIGSNYLIAGQEATRQGTAHPSFVLRSHPSSRAADDSEVSCRTRTSRPRTAGSCSALGMVRFQSPSTDSH